MQPGRQMSRIGRGLKKIIFPVYDIYLPTLASL